MERFIENTMYASRWLLAPLYFGLSIAVILLGIKFFQEAFHTLPLVFSIKEADLVCHYPSSLRSVSDGHGLRRQDEQTLRMGWYRARPRST
jgi:hypothetical protein